MEINRDAEYVKIGVLRLYLVFGLVFRSQIVAVFICCCFSLIVAVNKICFCHIYTRIKRKETHEHKTAEKNEISKFSHMLDCGQGRHRIMHTYLYNHSIKHSKSFVFDVKEIDPVAEVRS